jgi:hypothetical protein
MPRIMHGIMISFRRRFCYISVYSTVWHSFANEKMSDGTLEVGSCRLFKSDLFLTVLLVHFSMICISYI